MLLSVAQLRKPGIKGHTGLHASLIIGMIRYQYNLTKWLEHFINIKIFIFILWLNIWLLLGFYIYIMNVDQITRDKVIRM